MINSNFSFIILTFNEEIHLSRLLDSISPLNAKTYILDSGSTDRTLDICDQYEAETKYLRFENHPRQWNAALKMFKADTPWVICLDADQIISAELLKKLQEFKDEDHRKIDGIYFNRKNYFKGKWLRYGGYYPKFLLKMFRYDKGYSDLNENMDHRFQVPGKTIVWKTAHLIEENLKENQISFWIAKHNKYSDLLANEVIMRKSNSSTPPIKPKLWGSPNERNALQKKIWRKMPLYIRPFLYFIYRMIFQLGILDGRTGIIFHFLQGFWFRLIVDIKIEERNQTTAIRRKKSSPFVFLMAFPSLFILFYAFNIIYIGITTPGGYYWPFFDMYLNYPVNWRKFCISSTAHILKSLGYLVHSNSTGLKVTGHSGFRLVYSCLGYGIMSCFAAFVISFPKPVMSKIKFLTIGLTGIQVLNTLRFVLIAIFYNNRQISIDHHNLFNYLIYLILALSIYIWTNLSCKRHS